MKTLCIITLVLTVNSNLIMAQSGTTWVNKQYKIKGDWSIQKTDGMQYFVLNDNFSAPQGPDLKLYLTKLSMDAIENRDAVDKQGLFLGELKSSEGAQRYQIPNTVTITDYKSIVIHCKKYSVVWGGLNLN